MAVKPGTGQSTQHGDNKQNERGTGAKDNPFTRGAINTGEVSGNKWKSRVNPNPPNVAEGRNTAPKVHQTPKINEGTGGQPDGAKRVINTETKAGKSGTNTYTAPRSSGGGSATDLGYTKLGKV